MERIILKNHTKETKQKSRDFIKNWYYNTEEGKLCKENHSIMSRKWAAEHLEELKQYSIKGCHSQKRISSIETKLAEALKENFIKFEQQWKYKLGIADFIIKPYIIIFVDGDYWHNYPYGDLKDKIQTQYLQQQGFIVLRFWERDILSNLDNIIRIIKSFYKFKTNKRFLDTSYNEYFSNLHGNVV